MKFDKFRSSVNSWLKSIILNIAKSYVGISVHPAIPLNLAVSMAIRSTINCQQTTQSLKRVLEIPAFPETVQISGHDRFRGISLSICISYWYTEADKKSYILYEVLTNRDRC